MPCDKEVLGSIPANEINSFQDPVLLFNMFGAINGEKMCSSRVNLQGLNALNNGPANRRTQSYKKTFSAEFRNAKKNCTRKFHVKNFAKANTCIILCCKFFDMFSSCKTLSQFMHTLLFRSRFIATFQGKSTFIKDTLPRRQGERKNST